MRPILSAAFISVLLSSAPPVFAAGEPGPSLPSLGSPQAITSQRLRAHLEFIADDLLEGRNTPSRGLDIAALYIASQLKLWGVSPGGDNGTYFQQINRESKVVAEAKCRMNVFGQNLTYGEDYTAILPEGEASGNVVLVGYGLRSKSKGVDPYAGMDVKGKIVLVTEGLPKEIPLKDLVAGKIEDVELPGEAAAKLGAKAVVILQLDEDKPPYVQKSLIPQFVIKPRILSSLLAGQNVSFSSLKERVKNGEPIPAVVFPTEKTISFHSESDVTTLKYKNVVGIVRGSDPKLKNEYVAFGAHYDHVGMDTSLKGDQVFNGADDDGSGTVSVLEIAHAFASGPKPKRSALFIWHAGEEQGLWGSAHYADHPTVPIKSIVSQLNIDMIGRSRKPQDSDPLDKDLSDGQSVYVIGSRMLSDELGNTVTRVNKGLYGLRLDYKYDDPNDPEQFYYRSDHYNYAKKGIPIAFFFNGTHRDYHQVGDEVSKIDFPRMEKISRTIYAIGFQIASNPSRPKVNKKPS